MRGVKILVLQDSTARGAFSDVPVNTTGNATLLTGLVPAAQDGWERNVCRCALGVGTVRAVLLNAYATMEQGAATWTGLASVGLDGKVGSVTCPASQDGTDLVAKDPAGVNTVGDVTIRLVSVTVLQAGQDDSAILRVQRDIMAKNVAISVAVRMGSVTTSQGSALALEDGEESVVKCHAQKVTTEGIVEVNVCV